MNIEHLYELYLAHPTITTDSRQCPEGSIFFALKGTNFNGNRFTAKALEAGCAYAVVDAAEYAIATDSRYILVPDVLGTLQQLANYHRRQFKKPVIQITGTNGKTTTKELVATVLSERFNVLYTQGNLNNHIGVPLTLLRLRSDHDIAVIETGANHPGEIAFLTQIVQPDYGLITNVGHAHIEGFGSFEGVKKTKGELYDYLATHQDTRIFVNSSDATLLSMLQERHIELKDKCIAYTKDDSETCQPAITGKVLECNPFVKMCWGNGPMATDEVQTHLIGAYNIDNLLAAACVGCHFGVSETQVCQALSNYVPSLGRSEYKKTAHNELIIDAYNANLTSMHAALENFKRMTAEHKMLILGDMKELGADSEQAHAQILQEALTCHAEAIWLIGSEFAKAAAKMSVSEKQPIRLFDDIQAAKAALLEEQPSGFLVLIKGSNSTRLFEAVEGL